MEDISSGTVILIGMIIVFSVLILIIGLIYLLGFVMGVVNKKRKAPSAAPAQAPVVSVQPPVPAVVQSGVSEETVAVITAAVACMMGGGYKVRSIVKREKSRSAWAQAGTVQSTTPF